VRLDFNEHYADLLTAAGLRRESAPQRAVVGYMIAAILHLQLGWSWAYLWAAAYAAAQLFEIWALRPASLERLRTPSVRRAVMIMAIFLLPAAIFAPMAIPIWSDAQYGPVMAVLMLAGGGLNLLVMSGPSTGAFLGPFAIYIGVWVGLMVSDIRLPDNYKLLAVVLVAVVVAKSILAWRTQAKALRQVKASLEEAERRRLEAQAAVEAKGAFVAMICHDLRTPISAILAGAGKIEHGGEGARRYARLVREAGTMMSDLLGDLLDMERMDAGAMPVEQMNFNVRQVLAETLSLWREDAARNGLQLRCFGARTLPRHVTGDPTRLRQVLNNLLSNAVKFTPSGSITVQMAFGDGRLTLSVQDTGPGLGTDDPERVFQAFDQLDADIARRYGGHGLGLAISRKLVRLMQGELTAASVETGGARFTLTLPLPQAEPAPARQGPLRVLVVDDHSINRETLKILLEPLGVVPVLAGNGEAALEALGSEVFDLVLMDINMPGMDGREATRRLRAAGGPNGGVPVIAVSASDTPREWRACAEAGMNSHVAKPIRPHRLYEAINAALLLDQDSRALESAALTG
jgi:signal transduction histidine kinase/AmiR/NasT family two-component response regulator